MIYIPTDAVLTNVNICKLQSSTDSAYTGWGNGRGGRGFETANSNADGTVMNLAKLLYHTVICDPPSLSINLFRSIKSFRVLIRTARLLVLTRGGQCHYVLLEIQYCRLFQISMT